MAKQLTCAIIDDEPLAVKLLESYAQKTSFLNLVATYGSAVEEGVSKLPYPKKSQSPDFHKPGLCYV